MMRSRCAGRVGATPKPQLPMTTVVTPCHGDTREHAVPQDLGVVVGVDVDEAGRDDAAGGVDRGSRSAVAGRRLPMATTLPSSMADVAGDARGAGAVDDRAAA